MDDVHLPSRRYLLETSVIFGALTLAGCLHSSNGNGDDGVDNGDGGDEEDGDDVDEEVSSGDGGSSTDGDPDDLDLREANVVDVTFVESDGTYTFDVTLHHDDDGEEGYANWWQVEGLDGSEIARRELLHAHSNQPFTRSETMDIADDVACVVVRGYDKTHGYGGVAMLVSMESGELNVVDQGPEKQSFDDTDCP